MATLLEIEGLDVSYGYIAVVKGIDFALKADEITSLIGANDADRSTTLLALSGLIPKSQGDMCGQILFRGEDATQWSAHKRMGRGIVQVAEGRTTFTTMTVRENLKLSAYTRNTRKDRGQIASGLKRVFYLFPYLKKHIDGLAGNLSGGEQQMLAIDRALVARPRVLLLDEPSMGLIPIIMQEIFRILHTISVEGLTIPLIKQNTHQALKIAQHGCMLGTGEIVLANSGKDLLGDPRVLKTCLGG